MKQEAGAKPVKDKMYRHRAVSNAAVFSQQEKAPNFP